MNGFPIMCPIIEDDSDISAAGRYLGSFSASAAVLAAYFNEIWRILTFSEIVIPTSNQSVNSLGDGAGGVVRHNQTYADHDKSFISLRYERENNLSCYMLEEVVFLHVLHG